MAAAAVSCGQLRGDYKAMMVFLVLPRSRVMTVKAADALLGVHAQLIFVHNGVLRALVAFGALAAGSHEVGAGLFGFDFRARPVNQEGCQNQGKSNNYRHKNRSKRHVCPHELE
jgi:hypothetical protein